MEGPVACRLPKRAKRPPASALLDKAPAPDAVERRLGKKRREVVSGRTQLFDVEELPPALKASPGDMGLGTEAQKLSTVAYGGELSMPARPAAPVLARGPGGVNMEVFNDKEGRFYRIGELVWAVIEEGTPEGSALEERERALREGGQPVPRRKRGEQRRHGEKYYALYEIVRIEADTINNATAVAPRLMLQEYVNKEMIEEFQLLRGYQLPAHLRVRGTYMAAKGYYNPLPADVLDGHARVQWPDEEPSSEGVVIGAALDMQTVDGGPALRVVGHQERTPGQPFLSILPQAAAVRPTLRPPARSPFDESELFQCIEPHSIGYMASVGPILTGMSAKLKWGHAYLVKDEAGCVSAITFKEATADGNRAPAWVLPVPHSSIHPDVAFQLARPRHERAWCFHHSERILDLTEGGLYELESVAARFIVGSSFLLPFLDKEPVPFINLDLVKVSADEVKPLGAMVLPEVLESVQAYFASLGPLDEAVPRAAVRRAVRQHLRAKAPAKSPARIALRMPMCELVASVFFQALERLGGSLLGTEWHNLSADDATSFLERLLGSRAFSTVQESSGGDIERLYVVQPICKEKMARLTYDLDTQELVIFLPIAEFWSTDFKHRAGPMVVRPSPGARYSLSALSYVDSATEGTTDDAEEVRARFIEREWFAPHYGVWEE